MPRTSHHPDSGKRLHRLLLLWLVVFTLYAPPVGTLVAAEPAPFSTTATIASNPTPVAPETVMHLQGAYSPNTTIVWHDYALWFIRPPYQSQLLPVGDGTYTFAEGWLAGRQMQFTPGADGSISIQIRADDGSWHEFARSGEIYPDLDASLRWELEQILERTVNNTNIPGALLYVHLPGQGMWLGARGLADRGRGIPMVPLDRIRIASVTKTFVATIVLQLMQEGWLTLDDTVERWLPGLVPNGDRMQLRHLLNHTSGLQDYLTERLIERVIEDPGRIWTPYELIAEPVRWPPYFAPGQPGHWHYSNTNYILLGMVIEQVTGNRLEYEVYQRIVSPLGLYNTYFDPDQNRTEGIARGYVGQRDYTDINLSFAWAAGGMVSTVEDLGRFAQALFGGVLLGPDALQTMLAFVEVYGAWGSRNLVYGMGTMQSVIDIHSADPSAWGVAWGHTGALTGYRTAMWYMPQSGITVVAAVNQMFANPNEIVTSAMDVLLASRR